MNTLDRILSLLKDQHKTQKDLCTYLGLKGQAFTNWKNGHTDSWRQYLPDIADYFGVSVDYLLGKDHPKAETPATENEFVLSDFEKLLVLSYRLHPNMHESVCLLLDLRPDAR